MSLRHLGLVVALTIACEKEPGPGPQPGPAPEAVVVTVSLESLSAALAGVRDFPNASRPGAGRALNEPVLTSQLATAMGAASLDGIDMAGPLHIVILDQP